jgi:hypothetical protein
MAVPNTLAYCDTITITYSLTFVGKAMDLPWSGAPERCFTLVDPSLAGKFWTRLERLARDKHSSLLRKYVNYSHNKFYSTGPRTALII